MLHVRIWTDHGVVTRDVERLDRELDRSDSLLSSSAPPTFERDRVVAGKKGLAFFDNASLMDAFEARGVVRSSLREPFRWVTDTAATVTYFVLPRQDPGSLAVGSVARALQILEPGEAAPATYPITLLLGSQVLEVIPHAAATSSARPLADLRTTQRRAADPQAPDAACPHYLLEPLTGLGAAEVCVLGHRGNADGAVAWLGEKIRAFEVEVALVLPALVDGRVQLLRVTPSGEVQIAYVARPEWGRTDDYESFGEARYTPRSPLASAIEKIEGWMKVVGAQRAANEPLLGLLLLGETGTGKQLLVDEVERRFSYLPFIQHNGAQLSDPDKAATILFGHTKNAFTGAQEAKKGLVSRADGGFLFLDEFHLIPVEVRQQLRTTMDPGTATPVGAGATPERVSVALIGATSTEASDRESRDMMGRFLAVVVPPLRHRVVDLPVLAEAIGRGVVEQLGGPARDALEAHAWPENVRELKKRIELAAERVHGEIEPSHLGLDAPPSRFSRAASKLLAAIKAKLPTPLAIEIRDVSDEDLPELLRGRSLLSEKKKRLTKNEPAALRTLAKIALGGEGMRIGDDQKRRLKPLLEALEVTLEDRALDELLFALRIT